MLFCGIASVTAQENTEKKVRFVSGIAIEPEYKSQFLMPVYVYSGIEIAEKVELAAQGGYMFAQEHHAPFIGAEAAYKYEQLKAVLKYERVLDDEEQVNYVGVELLYKLYSKKNFNIEPLVGFGWENAHPLFTGGLKISYSLF